MGVTNCVHEQERDHAKRVAEFAIEAVKVANATLIDPENPSRWYLPCRVSSSRDQDQIIGGSNGKMSYKIPNVAMEKAVIQIYWLTANSCNPDGLKEYFTSGKWTAVENSRCQGDGGTVGGYRADHTGTCTTQDGKFPEEVCYFSHFTSQVTFALKHERNFLTLFHYLFCISLDLIMISSGTAQT